MSRFDASLVERALEAVRVALGRQPADTVLEQSLDDQAAAIAADLARRFEGFSGRPYLDAAGVPTIGKGATHYADGRRVKLTDPPISEQAADRLLLLQVRQQYLPAVRRLCPKVDQPRRLGALVDFTFNCGTSALAASTLRRKVNAGEWADVPAQLRRWIFAAGRALRGLVLRREAEAGLI